MFLRKSPFQNSKIRNYRSTSHIECFNFHKKGHYARDCPEKQKRSCFNYNKKGRKNYQRKNHDRRDDRRIRESSSDHEEHHQPQKKQRESRYEINTVSKSKYILISTLTSSSPLDLWGSWVANSGATHHFYGYI